MRARWVIGLFSVTAGAIADAQSLGSGFREPPADSRPLAWWHWMDGNISKGGIRQDLQAMADAGSGGPQIFNGMFDTPRGPIRFQSDAWYDHLRFAVQTAETLELTLDIMNCAGWSMAGGPWITPERSMKDLVWSEQMVTGPRRFAGKLPQPRTEQDYYRDVAVLAVPGDELADEVGTLTTTAGDGAGAQLSDGILTTGIPASAADFAATVSYGAAVERRLLELTYYQTKKGGGRMAGSIESSNDGIHFTKVRDFPFRAFTSDPHFAPRQWRPAKRLNRQASSCTPRRRRIRPSRNCQATTPASPMLGIVSRCSGPLAPLRTLRSTTACSPTHWSGISTRRLTTSAPEVCLEP